jgi:hypothetical protein
MVHFKTKPRMTTYYTILGFIIIFLSSICGQIKTENKGNELKQRKLNINYSNIAILPFDSSQNWVFNNVQNIELSDTDIENIERLIIEFIDEYNLEQEKYYNEFKKDNTELEIKKNSFIIELKRYKRQYVAVINENNEKEVWVNCFCDNLGINWKKNLVFVLDGGNCFFNLKINLTKEKCYALMVNGEA